MKIAVILLFAICVAMLKPTGAYMTLEQLKNASKMLRNSCAPKTGVSKESLAKASKGEFVEDDMKLKCYMKCVQGMMKSNKNGRYNAEQAVKELQKVTVVSPEMKKLMAAGITACKDAGQDKEDSCDLAFEVVKCAYNYDSKNFFFP